jgi:hypothetical protein
MPFRRTAIAFIVVAALFMVAPQYTFAAGGLIQLVPETCNDVGGCHSVCDIATLANNILNDLIYIAVILSAVLFAWAGVIYLTAMGNPSKVSSAKSMFTNVFIGLAIILVSWLVVDIVMRTLVGASPIPWNSLC